MGEVGEQVKAAAEEIRSLKRGGSFTLENLEAGWSDLLIEDFVFEEETLLSAKAIPIREGHDQYAVEFNLTTDPEEKQSRGKPLQGILGEDLLIVAEKPFDKNDRYRVAVGKEDVRGDERVISFDQWHPLPQLVRKPEIKRMLAQKQLRQSQPLTAHKSDLKSIKFITL